MWSLDGVPRVLYRLPELLAASLDDDTLVCEGEKDVENVVTSGAEGAAADRQGNVYGAEVGPKGIKRYVKKPSPSM